MMKIPSERTYIEICLKKLIYDIENIYQSDLHKLQRIGRVLTSPFKEELCLINLNEIKNEISRISKKYGFKDI